jgi:chorismate mutase
MVFWGGNKMDLKKLNNMNNKALFLGFSLMNAFIILPQDYTPLIKRIVTQEQNNTEGEFENYVNLIKKQLQHYSPLSNEQQEQLDSLLNQRKALMDEIKQSFLHEAFSQLLHQQNAPSIFSSLTSLRKALQNMSDNNISSQPILEKDLAEIDKQIEQIVDQQCTTSLSNRIQTYSITEQLTTTAGFILVAFAIVTTGVQVFHLLHLQNPLLPLKLLLVRQLSVAHYLLQQCLDSRLVPLLRIFNQNYYSLINIFINILCSQD